MPATSETRAAGRQILLVGPYGVLGTGVVDAVAENPEWGITTAARRPVPTYRAQDSSQDFAACASSLENCRKQLRQIAKREI
jgi:hypothetical protein